MREDISNVQIEKVFKNTDIGDINHNYVVALPSNHINKFIDHKLMISEKREISVYHSKYK